MVSIPLARSTYRRTVARDPEIRLINRYFEQDPTNQEDQVALLTRPALRKWLPVGTGPMRAVYSEPGAFDDALFTVSGEELYKVATDGTTTLIGGGIFGLGLGANVSMTATDEYLFVADGAILWCYTENARSSATLTATGAVADADTISVGGIYYRWTSGDLNAGAPDGTSGAPWLVRLGADDTESLANMRSAINGTGTPGTTYSPSLVANELVDATSSNATTLVVQALEAGAAGDSIAVTETGANIAWSGANLAGGGATSFTQVAVPDDVGIISVGAINSFVICVVAQGFGFNGRFYWIEPFQNTIDPLNFATAEKAPDPLWSVNIVGDQIWFPGTGSTEIWNPTADPEIPFLRQQGRLFDRGVWEGTPVRVKDTLILVDRDGIVYAIQGGPVRISTSGIEERIRQAMITEIALSA